MPKKIKSYQETVLEQISKLFMECKNIYHLIREIHNVWHLIESYQPCKEIRKYDSQIGENSINRQVTRSDIDDRISR